MHQAYRERDRLRSTRRLDGISEPFAPQSVSPFDRERTSSFLGLALRDASGGRSSDTVSTLISCPDLISSFRGRFFAAAGSDIGFGVADSLCMSDSFSVAASTSSSGGTSANFLSRPPSLIQGPCTAPTPEPMSAPNAVVGSDTSPPVTTPTT